MQGENKKCSLLNIVCFFFVFITSALIGKYISQKYKYRLEELEEMKNSLNIFKTKIKFTYEPISKNVNTNQNISNLFRKAKEKMQNETATKAWEDATNEFTGNLNNEDKQAIKTLSKLLRSNRHRRATKPNRNHRKFFRRTNKTSTRRKK